MTAQVIPLASVPSQVLSAQLDGATIRLDFIQRSTGLYVDIWLNNALIVAGAICLNATFIARYRYLGLPGDFTFIDLQGNSDPTYDGLGSRYVLIYQGY